jgi:hemolysin III
MRTKLDDRKLPNYSRGEEIFNMTSHIVGGSIGIAVTVICIIVAVRAHNMIGIVASTVYGATMITLYSISSIYHGLTSPRAKKIFQVLDHCAIYLLIAGTYTPIALSAIRRINPALGWSVFGIQWGLAALAITLTAIDLKKYQVFSMIAYIVMGWSVVFISKQVIMAMSFSGFMLLLSGGLCYTIGAILYGIGKKKKYMHNVFHIFVLLGSVFHFCTIVFFAL